jgi:hypothetical protein
MFIGPTTTWRPIKVRMKGNASLLFGWFHHSNAIFIVAHSHWLQITNHLNFDGIKPFHKKFGKMGPYPT